MRICEEEESDKETKLGTGVKDRFMLGVGAANRLPVMIRENKRDFIGGLGGFHMRGSRFSHLFYRLGFNELHAKSHRTFY